MVCGTGRLLLIIAASIVLKEDLQTKRSVIKRLTDSTTSTASGQTSTTSGQTSTTSGEKNGQRSTTSG